MPEETDDFEDNLCPMCLEELDITDRNFKPCQCGYQMCRFCWHHIKENLNGRCPACRSPYDADNYEFTPPDPQELAKIEKQKKDRDRLRKNQEANARKHLSNVRVIQRNLVYVTNLSINAAREDILKKNDFFGQYGKIVKAVINRNNFYNSNGPQGPSVSAYITYARKEDALTAIQAVDGAVVEGRVLRASFGTTKYCSFFLRNLPCTNPECMYLHELGGDRDSFTKEDMALGKHHIHETLPATVAPPLASKLGTGPKKPVLPPPGTRSSSGAKPLIVSSDKIPILSTSTRGWNVPVSASPPALNPEEWPTTLDAVNYHHIASTSPPPSYVRALSSSAPMNTHPKPAPAPAPVSALPATASWGAKSKIENPPPTSPRNSISSMPPSISPVPTPIPSPTVTPDPVTVAAAVAGIIRKNSMPAAVSVPIAKKEAQPGPTVPAGKPTKETIEVTDKSDKLMEPKSTASEGKLEAKAESKAEAKAESKADPKADANAEKPEAKVEARLEARLDIKEPKSEIKSETKEVKAEGKAKRKMRKEVSFEAGQTTPPTSESHTTPTINHAKPIGPPPGFKIDAAKQGIARMNSGLDGGSSSSSETENMGITRHSDRSSLTSSSETSAWNYGLKRSSDIAPPPGWNPPASSIDPWTKLTSQTVKSIDIPEMEQFDPWAENTALGIVDLLLKDNADEGTISAKATHQANPALAHIQAQAPPTFAVPSIPPPDFHWQQQIAPTRAQRSRFDFAREEDDPSTAINGTLNASGGFPLADPGIVAAKPASKSMDFEGRTTTGILPTPNLLAPYPLPPPGLMPLAGAEDWQRNFQALLPNVKISFANMAQAAQAAQAWDAPQDPVVTTNQKPTERRLSQSLPQGQPSQPQPPQPQSREAKPGKGAKQGQQSMQQIQQQQLQLQQHQLQIQQHHQQQQLQQHLQQQLHQHQQQQLMQHQQLQQLQQQQLHLQQLQQRQQQIHQLQLQQQLQQLQQLQDTKSPIPSSPRATEETNEWFSHQNETSYKHILQQKQKQDNQDKPKKGLDSSSDGVDTLPKGKASRPPGFPASSTQPSPPLSQQANLLPPPASLPFRDPAILGAGMAYMVPSNEEHHWGYRGPPPFPLQPPPHHQPPHMAPRGMGLVSILTPPPRTAMPSPFAFAPNATNGASTTSPPMMYAPNDILVPAGAGILGPPPGIAAVNSAPSNALAPTPTPTPTPTPSSTTSTNNNNSTETTQPKLSKSARKRAKQAQQSTNTIGEGTLPTPPSTSPTISPATQPLASKDAKPPTPVTPPTTTTTITTATPSATTSSANNTENNNKKKKGNVNNPNVNNQARDIEPDNAHSPTSSSSEREPSNEADAESVGSHEEKRKAKKKEKKAKNKDKKEKEQQKAAEAAKKKSADKENNPKKPQKQSTANPQPATPTQPSTQQPQPPQLPLPVTQPLVKQPLQQLQPTTTTTLHPTQKVSKNSTTTSTTSTTTTTEFNLLPANIANLSIGDVNIKFRNETTLSGDEIGFTVEVGGVGSSAVVETLEKEVANAKKELREWEEKLQQVKLRNGIF